MGGSSSLKRKPLLSQPSQACASLFGPVAVVASIYIVNLSGPVPASSSSAGPGANEIAQGTPSAGPLEILNAVWRVPSRADFDCTAKIAAMVNNGELHIKVGAAALGLPGPPPGVTGTLMLRYRLNGVEVTKNTRGGGTLLNIPGPITNFAVPGPSTSPGIYTITPGMPSPGTLEIVQALWRVSGQPDFDATTAIAALVKDGVLNTRVNWEVLGLPKPTQGSTVMLMLRYRVNGVEQTRNTRAGGTPLIIVAPPASLVAPDTSIAAGPATTAASASPIADDVKASTNSIEMKFVRIEPGESQDGYGRQ